MKHLTKILSLGTALVASASIASATPVTITNNNAMVSLTGATGTPVNTGTVYSNSITGTSGTFSGTLVETVYYDSSSPFTCAGGNGCLTFQFQFTNTNTGAPQDTVENVNVGSFSGGFSGFLTTAGYIAGSGTAPSTVQEKASGTVDFNWNPGFYGAGNAVFIQTNATSFAIGFATVTDGQSFNTTAPVPTVIAATPEPSSLIMLGTGLMSAAGMLVRRRKIA